MNHRRRFPWTRAQARRRVSEIIETAAAEVDRDFTLADNWNLVRECWPREYRTVMREIMFRRYSWY